MVPVGAADHSCLLVVTTCDEDPLNGAGIFDCGVLVPDKKQVALKNLHVLDPVPGGQQGMQSFVIEMHDPLRMGRSDLVLEWGSLPRRTRVLVALDKHPAEKVGSLVGPGVRLVRSGRFDPKEGRRGSWGKRYHFESARPYELAPGANRTTVIQDVGLKPDGRAALVQLALPGRLRKAVQFSLVQRQGRKVVGGSTYRIEATGSGQK